MGMSIKIRRSDRLFVLTGAGISAESGIPTFRGQDGLWEGHRLEDVATPTGLYERPGAGMAFLLDASFCGCRL